MVSKFDTSRHQEVRADYDRGVDVLYIFLGSIMPVEGDGLPRGVELDWALDDGRPCGVTVVGFEKNGWPENTDELAHIAAAHLSLPDFLVAQTIKTAIR